MLQGKDKYLTKKNFNNVFILKNGLLKNLIKTDGKINFRKKTNRNTPYFRI
jgi:hypothetical protein